MEIYSLFNIVIGVLGIIFGGLTWKIIVSALGMALTAWLMLFLLQSFGIMFMAKKQGFKRKWLAFIPFANIYYIGKLAGETRIFSQRVKRAGLYAMIGQILATVLGALIIASNIYMYVVEGAPVFDEETGISYWPNLTGFSWKVDRFLNIGGYIFSIFQLIAELLMLMLLSGLYKKYSPRHYFILGMLALFIPLSRFIVIFVIQQNEPIDYEAYIKARREAYMRQQQYYNQYSNPYGGPYSPYGQRPPYNQGNPYSQGNPYTQGNPYAQQNQTAQQPPKQEEPFAEFDSAGGGQTQTTAGGTPPETQSNDSDGFFD